ncbi:MAG: cysteine hydrolase [Sporomusaceae bacterium]|nr:cysteine hydrolase [Sporomusaceae bacterium]
MKKALLIIDVQNDYFAGGKAELFNPLKALKNIEKALALFRQKNLPVIYVQHLNTKEGATFFLPDTEGVLIHKNITPQDNEVVVTKHAPCGFLGTNLREVLKNKEITEVVVCGMMSHMCIDTTVRSCMDYGLQVTLLEDACATKNLVFRDKIIPAKTVHAVSMAALNGMFAQVISTEELDI